MSYRSYCTWLPRKDDGEMAALILNKSARIKQVLCRALEEGRMGILYLMLDRAKYCGPGEW